MSVTQGGGGGREGGRKGIVPGVMPGPKGQGIEMLRRERRGQISSRFD